VERRRLRAGKSQYSKIENGKVDPQFSTIEKIAKALKVNIVDLVAAEDIFKDVSAYDKTIVEKVQLVDLLDEQEKKGLFTIIDGLVVKQKLKQSLSSALNLAS
jgi:transcriptional regulator with XRE-family HTH domain